MELGGLVLIKEEAEYMEDTLGANHAFSEPTQDEPEIMEDSSGYGEVHGDSDVKEEPLEENYCDITVHSYFEDSVTLSESPWVKEEIVWVEDPADVKVDIPLDIENYVDSKVSVLSPSDIKQEQPEASRTSRRKGGAPNGTIQIESVSSKSNTRTKKNFFCNECDFKCRTAYYLSVHVGKHRPAKVKRVGGQEEAADEAFSCYLCRHKFNTKLRLSEHMEKHIKPVRCSYCKFRSSSRCNIEAHMKKHKNDGDFTSQKPENTEKPMALLVCEVCGTKFKKYFHLKKHHKLFHLGDEGTSGNSGNRVLTQTKKKLYPCTVCNFYCTHREELQRHLRKHTRDGLLVCPYCDYRHQRLVCLNRHMRGHDREKRYACEACDYECRDPARLKEHILEVHGMEELACNVCEYKTHSATRLKLHLLSHSGGYGCDVCGDAFTSVRKLHIHKQERHSVANLEPLACKFCDFRCSRVDNLITHASTHTGESSNTRWF